MPAFQSADAYGRFAHAVTWSTRYVRDNQANGFLDTLAREAEGRVDVIPTRSILWRAQLGHDWEQVREDDRVVAEVPGPFPSERMKPLRDRAREGRANPKGIPYLYVSTHRDTALAEVRPWVGSLVSVAQLRIDRDLRLVNCTEDSKRKHFIDGTPPEYWDTAVWCDIDAAFSRPVTATDEHPDYIPTQIIAECSRSAVSMVSRTEVPLAPATTSFSSMSTLHILSTAPSTS
ncbi:RES domain-containing protein [bacterium]|nr:MAG: RES domain-containing protein [bacterium]